MHIGPNMIVEFGTSIGSEEFEAMHYILRISQFQRLRWGDHPKGHRH
jgi:hypothetical protein